MINAFDREAFGLGTKVLALGLFILGSGIFLDYSVRVVKKVSICNRA